MKKNKYLPVVLAFAVLLLNIGTIKAQAPFITVWNTNNPGTSAIDQITIPTNSGGFNYDVQWASAADPTTALGSLTGQTGDVTITFPAPGIYEVSITGDFPAIFFDGGGDREKILQVKQWGDIAWGSMWNAFNGAVNLQITATDAPDLSAVTSMKSMFFGATSLNSNLNHWDVSNVTDMGGLFFGASAFNGNISGWDVSNVTNMGQMFQSATAFDGDLSGWDVSGVTNMSIMFAGASAFTGTGLSGWDVGAVQDMSSMFAGSTVFNADISGWDVSSVTNMGSMFIEAAAFNGNIGGWDVSNVTRMSYMFMRAAAFNRDLTGWDVSQVTTMERMFSGAAAFNGDLSGWDVSSVTNMLDMFGGASAFTGTGLSAWDVSQVTTTNSMFRGAAVFNSDLSGWDVSSVTDMQLMFYAATVFNADISGWDLSSVTTTRNMFDRAGAFNQNLGSWDITAVTDMENMFSSSGLSKANYDATLIGWAAQAVQSGVTLGAVGLEYCATTERQSLIDNHGWAFVGDAPSALCAVPGAFVTTWTTDVTGGASGTTQISIPTTGSGYNYDIQWVSVADASMTGSLTGQTGDVTITFPAAGTYVVSITGDFPRIYFNNTGDKVKIASVEQWGNIAWASMEHAFHGASNLQVNATDAPNLAGVSSMAWMFAGASSLNSDFNHWDVSQVTNMSFLFRGATTFNGTIGGWDVSHVTDMGSMFQLATAFNGDLGGWDVSNVTNMSIMFTDAGAFTGTGLGGWNVSRVTDMTSLFAGATLFNTDISAWDVSQVTTMNGMFDNAAAFDQNLGGWNIAAVIDMGHMLDNSGLSDANYDATIMGWAAQTVQPSVPLGAAGHRYCSSAGDRYALIHDRGWTITGDTYHATCTPSGAFVTTWNPGTVGPFVFTIPTTGTGYDYDVHWVSLDDPLVYGVVVNQTGNVTLTVPAAGTYRVSIVGDFPRIYINNTGDRNMVRTVEQWGNIAWTSMENAFYGAENLQVTATDAPNLSGVTSTARMFAQALSLNSDLNHWDVSTVTDMSGMFDNCASFNGDISGWNVSAVTGMANMLRNANVFDRDLNGWDIAAVADMAGTLDNTGLSRTHYDAILTGWAAQAVQTGVTLGATGLEYCAGTERQSLIDDHGWAIAGDMLSSSCLPPITGITFVDGSFVYDGTPQSLAITGTLPTGTSVSYVNNDRTDAGSQTVTAHISGGGVYEDLVLTATLTVTPATITGITFTDDSFVYDGTAQSLAIGGTLPAGTSVSYADNNRTDAGSQTATATISGGTNYADLVLTATLTVTPATITGITFSDDSFVYDGTARSLAISGTLPAGTSVSYADNSRMDVGSQTATATISGGTNYADLVLMATLTVTPATITGITFSDDSFVYDGTARSLAISGTLPAGTSVSYADNSRTDAGSQTATATISGGTNYDDLVLTATLTVTPATITGITFTDDSFVYDGTAQSLAIGGTLPAGTSVSYADNSRTDAGSQTATATISGGTNYADLVLTATLTVTPATITGITFADGSFVYDGTAQSLAIGGTLPAGTSVSYADNSRTDAGSQTATATISGGTNYADLVLTATLTVTPATITGITFADGSFVYDGTAQSLAIGGTLPVGTSVSYVDNSRTDVGSQTATATISGGTNYADLVLTATLTVTPATITGITFADGSFVYDGTAQSLAIGGTLPAGTSVSYADNSRTDAGSQTATATISGGTNYADLVLTATLTVTPATITGITFADGSFVYDGTAQSLAIGGTLPVGTSVSYVDNSRTDVGSQTATATISGGTNYADLVLTATLTVTPATITGITFADGSFVYDGTAQSLAIGGTLPAGTSVSYADNSRTDVGSQTATATISGGTNYADLVLTATLTVTPATITGITFADGSFVYDGTAQSLAIGGTLPVGTSVSYVDNNRTDAGSQTATATISGGTNYADLVLTATLTVTPATITGITFADGSFVYDGTAQSLAVSGTLPAGTSVSYADNSRTDVGSQPATAIISGGTNYADLVLTATLTVTPATITGITFADGSFVYDGTAQSLAIGGTLPAGTSVSYAGNNRIEVGSHTVTATIDGGANYSDYELIATLTILPSVRTLAFVAPPTLTYGDADHALEAESSSGEEILYSSSNEGVAVIVDGAVHIVGAGTTVITATVAENPLYENTPSESHTLTVNKAVQEITFRDVPAQVDRDAGTVPLDVSASSGLPVSLGIDDEEVAMLNGTDLDILRLGTVRITATQAGDANYESAGSVVTTIRVIDPTSDMPIRVHQAVSPNGDGINEYLIIEAIKDYPRNRVSVFNRNGTVVYEASGYNNGTVAFRGIGTGRLQVSAGTYFYIAEVEADGKWKVEKGWFVLRY